MEDDPTKPLEPTWLRYVRLGVTYFELALGVSALLLGACLGIQGFRRADHGSSYAIVGASVMVVAGGLLLTAAVALRRRHRLWWIPHLMLLAPVLWDLLSTSFAGFLDR